jgi:hypothetical protein
MTLFELCGLYVIPSRKLASPISKYSKGDGRGFHEGTVDTFIRTS